MVHPDKNLQNPYYFVRKDIVFNISSSNPDKDPCGTHKVTYVTELKDLKKGQTYYDLHGDKQTVANDGQYGVKTNELNNTKNSEIFPGIKVTYTKQGEDSNETEDAYYYFQSLIADGDDFKNDTGFKKHTTENGQEVVLNYIPFFKKSVENDIKAAIKKGYNVKQIMQSLPHYCFNPQDLEANKLSYTYTKDKETWKYTAVVGFSNTADKKYAPFTADDIITFALEIINEQTTEFANKKLKVFDKKVKDETTLINGGENGTVQEIE